MLDADEVAEVARRRVSAVLERCGLHAEPVGGPLAAALAIPVDGEICLASCLRGMSNRCILTVGAAREVPGDEHTLLRLANDHNVADLTARAIVRPSEGAHEVLVQETLPISLLEESPAFLGWLVRTLVGQTVPSLRRRLATAGLVGDPYVWGVPADVDRLVWTSVT